MWKKSFQYILKKLRNHGQSRYNESELLGINSRLGSLQATEVIKEILGIGESLSGYLNIYDLLNNNFRKIKVDIDPDCDFCKK